MAGIPDFDGFKDNINSCSAWSGNFGGRKKRAVGEENEEVPSIMETGNGALQWVKSLVRRARNAEPENGNGNGKTNGGKKGKGGQAKKKNGNGKNRKNGKGRKARKNGNKGSKKGGKGKGKGAARKKNGARRNSKNGKRKGQ